jgi:quinol monooxygenase YgiN
MFSKGDLLVSTKCVLVLHYKLKPGASQQFRKLLKDVLEECIKEPAFLTYTLHSYPDRPDEVMLYEVWAGTRERFLQEETNKPYRRPFMEEQKLYVERVDVDWSIPVEECLRTLSCGATRGR